MRSAVVKKKLAPASRVRPAKQTAAESTTTAAHRNVTLSLPESLLRRFRVYAAEQNQSMTFIATRAIEKWMEQSREREEVERRFLERIRNAPNRGTHGVIDWNRDEIHDHMRDPWQPGQK